MYINIQKYPKVRKKHILKFQDMLDHLQKVRNEYFKSSLKYDSLEIYEYIKNNANKKYNKISQPVFDVLTNCIHSINSITGLLESDPNNFHDDIELEGIFSVTEFALWFAKFAEDYSIFTYRVCCDSNNILGHIYYKNHAYDICHPSKFPHTMLINWIKQQGIQRNKDEDLAFIARTWFQMALNCY